VELPRVAQDHAGPAVHGLHDAANLDVHVAVLLEFTDLDVIFPIADDGEAAFIVRDLREHTSRKRVPSGSRTTS